MFDIKQEYENLIFIVSKTLSLKSLKEVHIFEFYKYFWRFFYCANQNLSSCENSQKKIEIINDVIELLKKLDNHFNDVFKLNNIDKTIKKEMDDENPNFSYELKSIIKLFREEHSQFNRSLYKLRNQKNGKSLLKTDLNLMQKWFKT